MCDSVDVFLILYLMMLQSKSVFDSKKYLQSNNEYNIADLLVDSLRFLDKFTKVINIKSSKQGTKDFTPKTFLIVALLNKSFKENVAWGVKPDKIDVDRVTKALYDVRLYDFVNQFENNIDAVPFIGSTGASLGQKQRLAIARALYTEPEILIFDEATSALDVKTEHEITDMLTELGKKKTIIAIAHRLSTLKSCNKLIYMKNGEIVDTGTFESLSARHPDFENLVKLSSIK